MNAVLFFYLGAVLLSMAGALPGESGAGGLPTGGEIGSFDEAVESPWHYLAFDRPPPLAGELGLAFAADSNPNLLAEDLLLPTPDGLLVDGSESDQVASLDLRLEVRPLYKRAGWSLGLALEGRLARHESLGFLDQEEARGVVTAAHGRSPLGYLSGPLGSVRVPVGDTPVAFLAQGGIDYLRVGGSSYVRRLAAAASLVFLYPRAVTATQVDLLFQDRTFFGGTLGDARRSGQAYGLRLSQTCFFAASDRYLRLGVLAEDTEAEEPFEASSLQPSVEANLPFGKSWSLYLGATRRADEYDHPESDLFNSNPLTPSTLRDDVTWRGTVMLSRRLPRGLFLSLRVSAAERDSNLDRSGGLSLDYERTVAAVRLSWLLGGES